MTGGEFFTASGEALLITRSKYTWSEEGTYGYNLTFNTYHCLKALKDALDDAEKNISKQEIIKQDIFLGNAMAALPK